MPAASPDQQAPRSQEVFISYSRKDKEFVRRLDEELKRRDREAWVDWEGIPPGDTWEKTIYGAIEATHTFIFVLTPDSIASEVCGREIAHAAANNKRLVPIVHRDVAADLVPKSLGELNWIFFRDSDDFEEATGKLISALDTDLKWVRAHTRLLTRAIEWDANGRNNSFVLRGEDLRAAERWLAEAGAQKERQPTALQTEYIIASRKASARRQRITLGAVTFGLVVAIVLAIVAFFAEAKAKDQTKKTSEAASRGNVSLARYSQEGGKNAQALAYLAQALRLNPENREAFGLTAAMLTQLSWHFPLTGSMQHDAGVNSAQFSPDGQRVVTTSWKTARLWDAVSGKSIGEPMKHEAVVNSAQFSLDGQRVVTASEDKTARVWDAASGKPVGKPLKHEGRVLSAQFSPDGQRVVTASMDKTVRLWDAASGKPIGEPLKHESYVNSAQFSPDGQQIVTASRDSTARLWDAASGKPVGEPLKHQQNVTSAQFSPDGQRVVTASEDNTARLWDTASGKPVGDPLKHKAWVFSAQFSPDGQRVVTASGDNTAQLWDAASGKPVGEPLKHERNVWSARFSPDGQRVVTASWDSTARLWDAASSKPVGEPLKHEGSVLSAQFSPDGQRVVTASEDKTARVWDAASGKPVGEPLKHEGSVFSGQFSPDGQRVVTASVDKTARLWDAVTATRKDTREDILLLAELEEATGGVTLETVGQAENLKLLAPEQIRASWEKIAAKFARASSELTPLQRFLKWSVSDRRTRTISPLSQLTVSEWLENRIKEGTLEGLRPAMQIDPANARVTANLGRRLADQALKQGADPDEARRARGEADFLTSRALKLAPDSDEVKNLREEVVKLLQLKTN
jgi:WD40 repeat protein